MTGELKYLKKIPICSNIYFDEEYYALDDEEIFVDVGAFDGDSIRDFVKKVKGKYKKIYAYEPDSVLIEKIEELVNKENIEKIVVKQFAIGDEDKVVSFLDNGTSASRIYESGSSLVNMKRLDDIISDEVTLIKMDIEGAEINALRGAEKLIQKYRPKLAISIYHRCEDLWEIPLLIHKMVPEYKFKVRHHTEALYDTVLYAYIEG